MYHNAYTNNYLIIISKLFRGRVVLKVSRYMSLYCIMLRVRQLIMQLMRTHPNLFPNVVVSSILSRSSAGATKYIVLSDIYQSLLESTLHSKYFEEVSRTSFSEDDMATSDA